MHRFRNVCANSAPKRGMLVGCLSMGQTILFIVNIEGAGSRNINKVLSK